MSLISLGIRLASVMALGATLACAPVFLSSTPSDRASAIEGDPFAADDPGLIAYAEQREVVAHTFPMVFDLENRFSAEIQSQIEALGSNVAFSGYLRDIRKVGQSFEVVLSGPFGTHILKLSSSRDVLNDILDQETRDAEERYYVVASIDSVSRPIIDTILEEEDLRLSVGSVIPPTLYHGKLMNIVPAATTEP